ncbi:MAG: hypothetical protein MZV70_16095 [Desulfobacterales bacterium]|nr:hypothetical protein [Desulfobacterales bacterium]
MIVLAMHPLQIEIYRKMTPEQKLRVSLSLYHSAWALKRPLFKNNTRIGRKKSFKP